MGLTGHRFAGGINTENATRVADLRRHNSKYPIFHPARSGPYQGSAGVA
ncbi:hypothetical protein LBMAG14_07370 [Actinomycetes bacterium]|nr:hypothetical protein LBMAG14_07370 [Actinomycetes bacterium]